MKGAIKPNHHAVNKYSLMIIGLPPLTPTTVSGLEFEVQKVELPDRTVASGGNAGAHEITITIPTHHTVEVAAIEAWLREGQDPVLPTYKKAGNITVKPIGFGTGRVKQLQGVWVTKIKEPDLEMANEGEMAVIEVTLSVDQVL